MENKWRQIEGKNPIWEALKADNKISRIVIDENLSKDVKTREILSLAAAAKIPISKVGWKSLKRLSQTQTHQGIIALAEPLNFTSLPDVLKRCQKENKDPLLVILPKVLYEYNLGAIIRTGEAAGIDCLIINKKNRLGPSVGRSSMGALEYLPIASENLFSALNLLKREGIKIVAAQMQAKLNYFEADLSGPLALVVGSEDKGISPILAKNIDENVRIPMRGRMTSLNMSVATGILLYEAVRQRLVKNNR